MADPTPEEVIVQLTASVNRLSNELRQARSDCTASAEYAVRAEDAAGLLRGERLTLILSLKHLYHHLSASDPGAPITTPGDSCEERHPKIKEYVD